MTQTFAFSTDGLRQVDRVEVWREIVFERFGVIGEPQPTSGKPFRSEIFAASGAGLQYFRMRTTPFKVVRRLREVSRRPLSGYILYKEASAETRLALGDNEFVSRSGEVRLWDGNLPFVNEAKGGFDLEGWVIPKALLSPHLPALGQPLSLRLSGSQGVGGLALNYLATLAHDISLLDTAQGVAVADNVTRLLAIACGAVIGEHGDAVRAGALGRARQYLQQHLSDPTLDPQRAAEALGMSVRQLHALFSTAGDSFSKYVQRRRLEECREALAGPMGQSRSVTDIAYGWGFNSLATFYRAFQREFGMAPGDLRARDEKPSRTG